MKLRFPLLLAVPLALAASLGAADRALTFDPARSTLEIAVKATMDSFTGKLAAYELTAAVNEAGQVTSAQMDFRFVDVLTGKPKRDKAMHEWQQTEKHPDARFVLTSLQQENGAGNIAFGRLTLHGVTRDLSFPVKVSREGSTYAIDGDAPVDTREFGLPVIRMMGLLKVDPVVHVKFHLQGKI